MYVYTSFVLRCSVRPTESQWGHYRNGRCKLWTCIGSRSMFNFHNHTSRIKTLIWRTRSILRMNHLIHCYNASTLAVSSDSPCWFSDDIPSPPRWLRGQSNGWFDHVYFNQFVVWRHRVQRNDWFERSYQDTLLHVHFRCLVGFAGFSRVCSVSKLHDLLVPLYI